MAKSKNIIIGLFFNKKLWTKQLRQANQDIKNFSDSVKGLHKGSLQTLANLTIAAHGVSSAFHAIKNAVAGPLQLAIANEQAAISFEVLLGSADEAATLIADLKKQAAQNPFEFGDMARASKTMLGFGIAAEHVRSDLKMLADVAAGDRDRLQSLALAFSQVNAAGRLMGQDLLQLINAGFNPLQTIAKRTGETMREVKDRMSQGAVSFEEVRQAFKDATSEGGLFFQMNERIFGTVGGMWSAFKNTVTESLAAIGEEMIEVFDLKTVTKNLLDLAGNFKSEYLPTVKNALELTRDFSNVLLTAGQATWNLMVYTKNYIKLLVSLTVGYAAAKTAVVAYALGVKAITSAVWLWNNASKALAVTQAFLLSLTGPRGLAMVAAGAVAAGVAYAGLEYVSNRLAATSEKVTETQHEVAESAKEVATQSTAATAAIDEMRKKQEEAQKSAEDLVKSLQFDLDTYGLSQIDKKLYKLWEEGVDPATLFQAKAIQDQIDALDELAKAKKEQEEADHKAAEAAIKAAEAEKKALADRAKAIIDENKTAKEKYEERIAEIQKLFHSFDEQGNRLLNREQAERAFNAAKKDLEDSEKEKTEKSKEGPRFGALALAGSAEAYKQIIHHRFGGGENNILSVNKQQLAEQKKQTTAAQQTAIEVKKLVQKETGFADLPG